MQKKYLLTGIAVSIALTLSACQGQNTASTAEYIGIDAAKDAALKDAGISSENASFSTAGLDSKNGTFYYEINFSDGNTEYLYDIDAMTGVVIEKSTAGEETAEETPAESSAAAPASTDTSAAVSTQVSGSSVSQDQAQSIALSHAGITEADTAYIRTEQDYSNGTPVFEVEFTSTNGTEYNYEIRISDGTILSYDFDAENTVPGRQDTANGLISEDQARETVLKRVPGAAAGDIILRLKEDDGRREYEGSLVYDNTKYEFKIDAYSGNLTEWEAEQLAR